MWNKALLEDYKANGSRSDGECSADQTHKMPACYQVCSEWCWATITTMASDYYKGQNYCVGMECAVASKEVKATCCPWSNSCHNSARDKETKCNVPGYMSQVADALSYYTKGTFSHEKALGQSELDRALSTSRVILILVSWNRGGGHVLMIGGCGNGYYYLHDPWGWYSQMPNPWQGLTYDQLLQYRSPNGNVGRWVESVFWSFSASEQHEAVLKQADQHRALDNLVTV